MKMFPPFLSLLAVLTLATGSSLRAQYDPPPPPDQQDQGAPPPDQQPPMEQDQNAPPPGDQGAPPDDQGAAPADAGGDANFQTFYNDLSSQGTWIQTDNYGYAWQPNVQDPNWAPYQDGHWVYTDEGWTWVAADSEPWGWATYHYGRWVNIDGEGWVWVPGYTWAPAWVSWRYGGGYCGWAPLPPDTFVGIDVGGGGFGFHIGGDCDTAYGIGAGYYHFVPVGYLGSRDYHPYYVNRYNNYTIINNTRNVTNIVVNNRRGNGRFGRVNAGGPNFATINAQSRTPVERAQLARSNRIGNPSLIGNRLAVYAPRVSAAGAGATYRPRNVGRTLNNVQINRGTNIDRPLTVNSRLQPSAASPEQVQAARAAQGHISNQAAIATSGVRPTQTLARPLTSYQAHTEARASTGVRTPAAAVNDRTQVRDRSFTGGAPAGNRTTEEQANRQVHSTIEQNRVNPQVVPSQANNQSNANAEAVRAEREQAQRTQNQRTEFDRSQIQHAQSQAAQGDRIQAQHGQLPRPQTEQAPVQQHQQVQHAEVQHAAAPQQQHEAPPQRSAPESHPSGGGTQPGPGQNKDHK